ncbi:hypothetical protein GYMLUDRAFT_243611 [Collybiopsis luxurians FD-317 M1]|uniref:Fungal STAND N-terminal Goodbye domain-containing protein n=1 Tax=Collybiopsis luxurians FD-317 M1 TaxID=944289 RepID=A0A0D0CQT8_9AGAR|nr:hypothetical protein GYMLUDRAFT_243611 [Collybiopsis luxurians FD-317 M1]
MTEHHSAPVILASSAISIAFAIVQPATSNFEILWTKALADYKEQTGHDIYDQHHMVQLLACPSIEHVVHILETQSSGLQAFQQKGKNIWKVLKPFVHLVELLNNTVAEAAVAASVPGGKAIFVAFGVLLEAANGVTEVYNALEELSEKLQDALTHVELHLDPNSKLSSRLKNIYIQMLVQVLHVFGFLMKYLNSTKKPLHVLWQHSKDYGKSLLEKKEVQAALQKLDKLTNREALIEIAEIYNKVYDIGTKVVNLDTKIDVMQSELLIVAIRP